MSQVGWHIWRQRRKFDNVEDMIRFVEEALERREEDWGPDYCETMVGYDDLDRGVALNTISDWEPSVIDQVESDSQHFVSLNLLKES